MGNLSTYANHVKNSKGLYFWVLQDFDGTVRKRSGTSFHTREDSVEDAKRLDGDAPPDDAARYLLQQREEQHRSTMICRYCGHSLR
jgi:hypothetical protein